MSTPVVALRHDPDMFINYTGADPDYYPSGGPVVVETLHAARVEARDLDALEISSGGSLVVTTGSNEKALEVRALGVVDPAVVDTTVLDAGERELRLESQSGVTFASDTVTFSADTQFRSGIEVADPATPTFHHVATPTGMLMGSGVLSGDDEILSGAFLRTSAESFELRNDSAAIASTAGSDARIRYDATHSHEFFAGAGSGEAADGTGAVQILSDKIVIRRDVDIVGSIDAVATEETSLRVADQLVRLAHTDDPATAHRDALLAAGKAGIIVDTVPASYEDDADYMGRFTDVDGQKLFVYDDSATIDVSKAKESGLFVKEVAYYVNGGMREAGARTPESRANEPYWNIAGGALRLSHTVADGDGRAKTMALGFRVADDGTLEMIRVNTPLVWDVSAGAYARDPDAPTTVKVVMRYVDSPVSPE